MGTIRYLLPQGFGNMNPFKEAFELLMIHEGGYVNNPSDPGGETNWGVTKKTALRWGFTGDMRDFPKCKAEEIYKHLYWEAMKLQEVAKIAPKTAIEAFECGVNMGPTWGIKFIQLSLNALNRDARARLLKVDGEIGKKTLKELRKLNEIDTITLVKMQNALQGARYIQITQKNRKLKTFVRGWFRRVF